MAMTFRASVSSLHWTLETLIHLAHYLTTEMIMLRTDSSHHSLRIPFHSAPAIPRRPPAAPSEARLLPGRMDAR